jgi:hypothetical protein
LYNWHGETQPVSSPAAVQARVQAGHVRSTQPAGTAGCKNHLKRPWGAMDGPASYTGRAPTQHGPSSAATSVRAWLGSRSFDALTVAGVLAALTRAGVAEGEWEAELRGMEEDGSLASLIAAVQAQQQPPPPSVSVPGPGRQLGAPPGSAAPLPAVGGGAATSFLEVGKGLSSDLAARVLRTMEQAGYAPDSQLPELRAMAADGTLGALVGSIVGEMEREAEAQVESRDAERARAWLDARLAPGDALRVLEALRKAGYPEAEMLGALQSMGGDGSLDTLVRAIHDENAAAAAAAAAEAAAEAAAPATAPSGGGSTGGPGAEPCAERAKIRALFERLDADRSGTLDCDEMGALALELGLTLDADERAEALADMCGAGSEATFEQFELW